MIVRTFCRNALLPVLLFISGGLGVARAQWTPPTQEELSMTAQPEVPGAPAVYLFREEVTDDKLHAWTKYVRIKVLTERGKEYANVELRQYATEGNGGYTISDIQGRTIHSDGAVIPFTGKPYEKLIEKQQGFKEQAKIFTLPDVQVGSILEYRYVLRYDDNRYLAPSWFVQSELYTRKAHYLWRPTDKPLITVSEHGDHVTNTIAWSPILPKGFEVKQARMPGDGFSDGQASLELNIHDVPPFPEEEYMPPVRSLSYRVLFYYSPYRSVDEYWKSEGKSWSKAEDKFIGPGAKVLGAVTQILTPAETTDEAKLRKLYAEVMKLENTAFTRRRSVAEDKAEGMNPPKSTDDIWERKRGTDDQMAELFVAMARAAGFKAYVMSVTNRDESMFLATYLSFGQLNDDVAIVSVGGKEQYFDPGQRFCSYGHLAWKHTMAEGVRQSDAGTVLASAPAEPYTAARTQRVANLTMDEHGEVVGRVDMQWNGVPALGWRQRALRGDRTSLEHDLQTELEQMLPGGMEVKVGPIENLEDYEKPLAVSFQVKGAVGSGTGKRLLVPADVFQVNHQPTFPHEKRQTPVYFEYPHIVQDAVRIVFPSGFAVESVPSSEKLPFQNFAVYQYTSQSTANSITVRRDFDLGNIIYTTEEYPALRAFYSSMESKDQEPAVLKIVAQASGGS